MTAAVMFAWLAISCACAAFAATAPLRWAAPVVAFCIPMSGTAALMLGGEPLLFPLVVALGFLARHALSLLTTSQLNQFLDMARADLLLLTFVGYCVISGLFFPKLFAGKTSIYPQVFVYGGVQLGPQHVSFVQLLYLVRDGGFGL